MSDGFLPGGIKSPVQMVIAGDRLVDVAVQLTNGRRLSAQFEVPPLEILTVQDQFHQRLPRFDSNGGWWGQGASLGILYQTLEEGSVQVHSASHRQGEEFLDGKDFQVYWQMGQVGQTEDSRIGDRPTYVSFRHTPPRLDSVVLTKSETLELRLGRPQAFMPQPPSLASNEARLGNIYQVFRQEKLTNGNLFPILEVGYHVRTLPVAEQLLPNTMRKLRNGDTLKILAWGDSITEGEYVPLPQENCWQSQLVSKLHERFPAARLELVTSAWGNHNSNDFLQERAGAAHNYVEQVIDVRPDLVISEFLNDRSLTDAQLDTNYRRFLVDFRAIGAEWLILTPPYTAENAFVMMPPEMQKQVESDERHITAFLRRFAIENHLPLAEAGERFVALRRQGIPHLTVMVNNYNHPGIFGLSLLADAALQIFPER